MFVSWLLVYSEARHEINEVYDARLGQSAKTLALSVMSWGDQPPDNFTQSYTYWLNAITANAKDDDTTTPFGHPYEDNLFFQYRVNDALVGKSPNAPAQWIGTSDNPGFDMVTAAGEQWRTFLLVFTLPDKRQASLLVAEKEAIRQELMTEVSLTIGLPQLLLIPLLAVIVVVLVSRAFRPLGELKETIAARSVDNLDHIHVSQPTVELSPLVKQINYLFSQLNNAWVREKRLVSTAAHELKTPLAVLRLNAENALSATTEAERDNDLTNILNGIDRTDRVIQQLLMLSRVEQQKNTEVTQVDIVPLLREQIAALAPMALTQQQSIELEGQESLWVKGHPVMLSVLFTNLIDNAIRYAGKGASISVITSHSANTVVVEVIDSGDAISDEIKSRIFDKFFRGHTEKGDGAGLGMSIVKDIVEQHHASIMIQSPYFSDYGNGFTVTFPMV
ncbi:ATP-binding protein [Salinivibrio kushneri]|uniref:histidine kinase n=1 Tax=Salinivibrio kushneri TaxID=1908198 RepID=A0AA47KNX3_9GAMM|nr:ATP-binding protein [Salinivibrio kushneri]WBA10361.1 ATP-binding protein [Salinivibrio kushneri]